MASRKFSKDYLLDILDTKTVVHTEITGTRRWSVDHWMVFLADDGLHYGVSYSTGATEQQDERPFEYDPEEIDCTPVQLVERTIKEWQEVK